MGNRGPLSSAIRDHVVGAFIRGTLATLQEGALVAGVDRTTVERWLKAAGIDWKANRLRYLVKQHRKAVMLSEGKTVRRPSKQEMRERATRAKQEWDAKQDSQSGRAILLEAQAKDGSSS